MHPSNDPRATMVDIARLLCARRLTNSVGGNTSCRLGDRIHITPRRLGSLHRWRLTEEMVLVFGNDLDPVSSDPSPLAPPKKVAPMGSCLSRA
jgi:ribulose-5-phosphate 4-epimerase/fuculose-1-phosphate aldolase